MRRMLSQKERSTHHTTVRHDGQLVTWFYGVTSWLCDKLTSFSPFSRRATPPAFLISNNICDLVHQPLTKTYRSQIAVEVSNLVMIRKSGLTIIELELGARCKSKTGRHSQIHRRQHAFTGMSGNAGMSNYMLSPYYAHYHNWQTLNFTASDSSSDNRCFLKVLIVLQLMELAGSKFQSSITLFENTYFLTFSLNLFLNSFWSCRLLSPSSSWKNNSGLIPYFLLTILKVSIGYQSTRHTVMSSHGQLVTGQLVTHVSHHKVNSSQATT